MAKQVTSFTRLQAAHRLVPQVVSRRKTRKVMMIARLLFPVVHQDRRRGMMRKKSVGTAAPAAVVAAAGRVAKTGRVIAERERDRDCKK